MPKTCWKYSLWNSIKLFSKTSSNKSMIKSRFELMSLYSNTNYFINSIACSTGMFVNKLLNSTAKKKHFASNYYFPSIFTRLCMMSKNQSNPRSIDAGVKNPIIPRTTIRLTSKWVMFDRKSQLLFVNMLVYFCLRRHYLISV